MMQLIDILIETDTDLDWCTDPSDLERAVAKRLREIEARDDLAAPLQEKLAHMKLAGELGRVTQH
jgi:hypothetical protein